MKNTKEDDNLSECIKELESLVQTLDIYSYSANDGSVFEYSKRLEKIIAKIKAKEDTVQLNKNLGTQMFIDLKKREHEIDKDNFPIIKIVEIGNSLCSYIKADTVIKYLNLLPQSQTKTEDSEQTKPVEGVPVEFLLACKEERINFVNKINEQDWNTGLRMSAEGILIMYDQLMERLSQPSAPVESAEQFKK